MRPFSLLMKPTGGGCNISCRYCFYKSHKGGMMDLDVARRVLDEYAMLPFAEKSVALQGGEPLLASASGIIELIEEYPFEKSIQTNATLLTDSLARRFHDGGWLVGASLDGPRDMNRLRDGSFDDAVRGIRLLEKHDVDYNILTVVSKANVAHPVEVYRFLRDNFRTRFHQYIECTGPCDEITGEEWGAFLVALFDEWLKNDSHTISIRLFESIASQALFGHPTQCSFDTSCRHHLVVEHDGSVYPCDFHVREDLRLGRIGNDSLKSMLISRTYSDFSAAKTENLPERCRACRHLAFCNGDCPRNRQTLCAGWIRFFDHALPRLRQLAIEAAVRQS